MKYNPWLLSYIVLNKPDSQSCAVTKSETFWRATGHPNLAYKWLPATKASKVGLRTHTTALWQMEQSSILFAKCVYPVDRQNFSLLAIAHDCIPLAYWFSVKNRTLANISYIFLPLFLSYHSRVWINLGPLISMIQQKVLATGILQEVKAMCYPCYRKILGGSGGDGDGGSGEEHNVALGSPIKCLHCASTPHLSHSRHEHTYTRTRAHAHAHAHAHTHTHTNADAHK